MAVAGVAAAAYHRSIALARGRKSDAARYSSRAMIDRCICHEVTFAALRSLAEGGADLPELQRRTGCGSSCGLCLAYLARMLATGETTQRVMSDADARVWTARALDAIRGAPMNAAPGKNPRSGA